MEHKKTNTLVGKTALVTGSVQGIGLAIAKALGAAGARVAMHGLAEATGAEAAVEAVRAAGALEVAYFPGDLRDQDDIAGVMAAVEAWGPVDILVNNAGVQVTSPFAEISDALWHEMIAVNLSACFFTMRAVLPGMAERGYGRVINIASVHGLTGSATKSPYAAAKHGLIGLSRAVSVEYARAGLPELGGVTVNCIAPGFVETPILEPQITARTEAHGGDRAAGIAEMLAEKQPSRRISMPEEIGALAVFLVQPIAHNMTGAVIPIDGGWTAQ